MLSKINNMIYKTELKRLNKQIKKYESYYQNSVGTDHMSMTFTLLKLKFKKRNLENRLRNEKY